MASVYGANHTNAFQTVPAVKLDVGVMGGRGRVVYDTYSASGALSANDKIYLGRLPKGARVKAGRFVCADLGTTGVIDIGYEYVNSADGTSDQDGFFAAVDVHTAAVDSQMAGTAAAYMLELSGDAYIVAKVTTATTAAGALSLLLEYVVD